MSLVAVPMAFILVAFGIYIAGTFLLAKFAFRISKGKGIGVLLFPPYALYFAIFGLEESGKEMPTAMSMFGVVTTAFLILLFWHPLSLFASGDMDTLNKLYGDAVEEVSAPATPTPSTTPAAASDSAEADQAEGSEELDAADSDASALGAEADAEPTEESENALRNEAVDSANDDQ